MDIPSELLHSLAFEGFKFDIVLMLMLEIYVYKHANSYKQVYALYVIEFYAFP